MNTTEIKQIIKNELPVIVRNDVEMQKFIINLVRTQFADKVETESRFDRIMNELQRDREEQRKKWDEQDKKWEENKVEQDKKWAEQNKKWEENQKVTDKLIEKYGKLNDLFISTLGAMGSRWGLNSEESFRNALKGILEEFFDITVENITEFDTEGYVFGRPDQIELDIIIKNGLLIIIEIKSSMSRSDMYTFGRKVEFYEKMHNKKVTRKMVVSPMVNKYALGVAKKLDIEVYSYTEVIDEL